MINGISGGSMAPQQMSAMRGQRENPFDKVDSNGDGAIDETEFSAFAVEMSEKTGQSMDADQKMSEIDTDGDGLLSQEEFKAGRPEGPPPGMMNMMGGMRGDGGMQAPPGMLGQSETDSLSSIDPLDTNGDGIVDAEEAKSGTGSSYYIQEYMSQGSDTGSQLSLQI